MDLTNQQIKDTYGNVLTIGTTAGSPTTGTLQNGEGLDITSLTLGGTASIVGSGGYALRIYGGGTTWLPALGVVGNLGFGPAFTSDTFLTRDGGSGLLAQRNSTNAQTFNIYNTYTDGSNYERGFLKWNSNVLEIGTEKLGTGTQRNVKIDVGTGSVTFAVGSTGRTIVFGDEITTTAAINMSAKNIDNTANIFPDGDDSYIIGEISTDKYYKAIYAYDHHLKERSADPSDPSEGKAVMWQSDGTGTGDDGDILIKITAGGVTKTATLVDFSTV